MKGEKVTVGPFTWTRDDDVRDHWTLDDAVELVGMHWYCQDYGPPVYPDSPFQGWRVGSGGPFLEIYKSREEAMQACVPFLLEHMEQRIIEAKQTLEKRMAILARVQPLPGDCPRSASNCPHDWTDQ